MDKKIISLYKQGLSGYQIMDKLNISSKFIVYKILKDNNLTRDYEECRHPGLNSDYFSKVDSDEKAYIVGFIFADGCIRKTRPGFTIAQHPDDLYILQQIQTLLGTTTKIQISKQPLAVLYVNNKKMRNDLIRLGCLPQKSLNGGIPKIPKKFRYAFIRGVFDGDGSIYSRKKPHLRFVFDICGHHDVISWCHKELKLTTKITKHGNTVRLEVNSLKQFNQLYKYLYRKNCIHLKRKKLIFEQACAAYENKQIGQKR
jgi:hypothetical protein